MGINQKLQSAALAFALALGVVAAGAPAHGQIFEDTMFDADILKAIRDGDNDQVRASLIAGDSPNDRSGNGNPAILVAVEARNVEAIGILAEEGARLDTRNRRNDRTALTRAAELGHAGMVRALLEGGADVDRTGEGREPALIKAARNGHDAVIRVLIEFDVDLYASDLTGMTALEIAEQGRHRNAVAVLRDAGAP